MPSPPRASWRPAGPAVLALLAAVSDVAAQPATSSGAGQRGRSAPATVAAASSCFTDSIRVTGYVVPRAETGVALGAEGYRIAEVLVAEGDTVTANQELIRLARLRSDPGAPVPPGDPGTISLRAPAAGLVTHSNARPGSLTRAGGEPLLRIVTDATPDVLVEVPSPYVTRFRIGTRARILAEDGSDLPVTVRVAATDVDPATQFGRARLSPAPGTGLRLGSFARAVVDVGQTCGVSVPRSAIARNNDLTSVEVVRGGVAETRRVRLGTSSEGRVEIREGLAEGEQVVLNAGLGSESP